MIAVWEIFPEVAVGIFTDDPVVVEKEPFICRDIFMIAFCRHSLLLLRLVYSLRLFHHLFCL